LNKEKKEMLMTEARLKVPPSEKLVKYVHIPRLEHEKRHFCEFMKVDMAHTVMLVEQKILSREDGTSILRVLKEIRGMGPGGFPTEPTKGSFLLQVEGYLFSKIGEAVGGKMHTGRSRIDQGATVRRLYARNRLLEVLETLNELQAVVLKIAERYSDTIMPGYTHMQHAQPWIFGHYLLSFFQEFNRDFLSLTETYSRTNMNPLGTAALVGTSWPLDRDRTTELLAFDSMIDNSKLGREEYYAAELVGMLSITMSYLNDLATDLQVWSTYEFRLVEIADEYCGSSSIMPQKKNPVALERVRRVGGDSTTWLATALSSLKGLGTGDTGVREVSVVDDALELTSDMLNLMSGILDSLIVHEDRMRELVGKNWSTANNLADFLVRERRLSYRTAHHVVARLVAIAVEEGKEPMETTSEIVDRAAKETIGRILSVTTEEVRNVLDPSIFVETRVTKGSINLNEIERMLKEAKETLINEREWISRNRDIISNASEKLEKAMDSIISS